MLADIFYSLPAICAHTGDDDFTYAKVSGALHYLVAALVENGEVEMAMTVDNHAGP